MTNRRRQRGAALLTAMVVVVLVATLGASMLWQQWRSVQVEAAERARTQSAWILSGAQEWALLILREDYKNQIAHPPLTTTLGDIWATPLAEARLSSFLANGDANAEDAPDAFLSGAITDAQARLNLVSLVAGGMPSPDDIEVMTRICNQAGVKVSVANDLLIRLGRAAASAEPAGEASSAASSPASAAGGLAQSVVQSSTGQAPLYPRSASELTWLGVEPESARLLEPYVVVIEGQSTKVNINTATRELIAAVSGDPKSASEIVQRRQLKPYTAVPPKLDANRFSVDSSYFEVRGRLRLGDVVLEQRSLVSRNQGQLKILYRERVSDRDVRS